MDVKNGIVGSSISRVAISFSLADFHRVDLIDRPGFAVGAGEGSDGEFAFHGEQVGGERSS